MVPIPDEVKKEIELKFLHEVVNTIEEHNIPLSLIINLDQLQRNLFLGQTPR